MSELESLQYLREVCAACTLAHPGRKADASALTQPCCQKLLEKREFS